MTNIERIDLLKKETLLPHEEWTALISTFTENDRKYAADTARGIAESVFGRKIFFRGIIEFTNFCCRDCYYCGIRRSNKKVIRYRLTEAQILECCREGYDFGYRTFVLQGGEDAYFTDERMAGIIGRIRAEYPDCAITLSLGERGRESFLKLKEAGADRYLLRHETADPGHFGKLKPADQTYEHRFECLRALKEAGFQTGCGMMIGAPYQTAETLAADMEFMRSFEPAMIGMGPFIPHKDTPFGSFKAGSTELTLFLLSLTRIMMPHVLLPATTALGTVRQDGRQMGVAAGCNVIMPNLSPLSVRRNYLLYDNKAGTDISAEQSVKILREQMEQIGYEVVSCRGDFMES